MPQQERTMNVSARRMEEIYQPIWNEYSKSGKHDPDDYDFAMETREGRRAKKMLEDFYTDLYHNENAHRIDKKDFFQWVANCERERTGEAAREEAEWREREERAAREQQAESNNANRDNGAVDDEFRPGASK